MADYALMNQLLFEGKANDIKIMTEEALEEGLQVNDILNKGLIAGMSIVGEDFKRNILFVPEVLIAARAMKAGLAILKPLLVAQASEIKPAGTLVMGTVKGDLHDIGKNLVLMMAEGAGYHIFDLGVDTSIEKFMECVQENNADIVGMSALLTTTMPYMAKVISAFKENGLEKIKITVGGAPVSQMFADEIGADGYGTDAPSAVELFNQLQSVAT
jgi:5-methyltetrahydrofolate--homocysteine methyltransferase